MRKSIVSALAVLAVLAWSPGPASAQAVRIGAAVRVSDNLALGIAYRAPLARWAWYHDGHRWRRVYRDGGRHRRFAVRHLRYLRQLEREHALLHRDMRLGWVSNRQHRLWHEAVGITHREFRHGLRHLADHGRYRDDDHRRYDRGRTRDRDDYRPRRDDHRGRDRARRPTPRRRR